MTDRQTNDPLSYLGVRASTPSNVILANRAPLTSDTTSPSGNIRIGDVWVDESADDGYMLLGVGAKVATWKIIS